MKHNKTTFIILGVGAFLVAAIVLGWIYLQKLDEQQQIASSFSLAQKKLAAIKIDDLNASKDLYTRQISQYNSQITDTKSKLSSSKNSLDATDDILAAAKPFNFKIEQISSAGIGTESYSGVNCQTLGISLRLNGDLSAIANFVPVLSQMFPTGVVTSTKIDKTPLNDVYQGQINLIIYNYKGK
jgi:hypothetical protein